MFPKYVHFQNLKYIYICVRSVGSIRYNHRQRCRDTFTSFSSFKPPPTPSSHSNASKDQHCLGAGREVGGGGWWWGSICGKEECQTFLSMSNKNEKNEISNTYKGGPRTSNGDCSWLVGQGKLRIYTQTFILQENK